MENNQLSTLLRDETIELLKNRPNSLSIKAISKRIGKTPQWINALIRGDVIDPGVCTIETLNAFLKEQIKKAVKNV